MSNKAKTDCRNNRNHDQTYIDSEGCVKLIKPDIWNCTDNSSSSILFIDAIWIKGNLFYGYKSAKEQAHYHGKDNIDKNAVSI